MQPDLTNGANVTPVVSPAIENPMTFPKAADRPRLMAYDHGDKLYKGEHYKAFSIKAEKGFSDKYAQLRYITANFAGLLSRVMADMMIGEGITVDCTNKGNQKFIDAFMEVNHLEAQIYESELANSRRGDSVFKLRVGAIENNPAAKSIVIAEEIPAGIYFPVLDGGMGRNMPKEDVLIWQFQENSNTYLHKEIHRPGYIFTEIYSYDPAKQQIIAQLDAAAFGYKDMEETGVMHSLVFHIPNVRDDGYFGASDYQDLEQLFFALNNRITKIDNILDKHSDPILAVPVGVIDEEGKVRKEALNMFEVDNENPGFNKPEYIVWNANLEYAFKEIDKLIDLLYMFSGVAQASTGYASDQQSAGQAESGRALKFKLLSTIRKRNQKIIYYDIALKEMFKVAMELAIAHKVDIDGEKPVEPEKPSIDWGDGVINDITEEITNETMRIEAGISSRADSIARIDGVSPDEAAKKVKEIDAEEAIVVPSLEKPTGPGKPAEPAGSVNPPPNTNPPIPAGK